MCEQVSSLVQRFAAPSRRLASATAWDQARRAAERRCLRLAFGVVSAGGVFLEPSRVQRSHRCSPRRLASAATAWDQARRAAARPCRFELQCCGMSHCSRFERPRASSLQHRLAEASRKPSLKLLGQTQRLCHGFCPLSPARRLSPNTRACELDPSQAPFCLLGGLDAPILAIRRTAGPSPNLLVCLRCR